MGNSIAVTYGPLQAFDLDQKNTLGDNEIDQKPKAQQDEPPYKN